MMTRASASLLLAGFLLALSGPSGGLARTEEKFVWTEKASEGFISLVYGPLGQYAAAPVVDLLQ